MGDQQIQGSQSSIQTPLPIAAAAWCPLRIMNMFQDFSFFWHFQFHQLITKLHQDLRHWILTRSTPG